MARGSWGTEGRQRGSLLARARSTRRLREWLRPEQGGAALAVIGLVFFSEANPGKAGTAILARAPGSPHYAWGRVHPTGYPSRRATEVA